MRRWIWRILLAAVMLATLTGTALAADPTTVTLENGIVLTADGSNWIVTGYTGGGGRVIIPPAYNKGPITAIGASAFKNTKGKKVSEVIFPNTITSVGSSAFENCNELKTVLFLPDSTGEVTIGKSAFSGTRVETLVLPDNLVRIEESAFANNMYLTKVTIPDSVKNVGSKAFANNTKLKTVYIPETLKTAASGSTKPVSKDAFANTQLESIHYGGDDKADVLYTIFEAMPTGIWRDQVHLATDSTHVNSPTCEDDGLVMGGGFCREASEKQTEACKSLSGNSGGTTIKALGHDYQVPPVDMTGHFDCETWTWKFKVTCPRCGEEIEREKQIVGTGEHDWEEGKSRIEESPSCSIPAVRYYYKECKICHVREDDPTKTETLDPKPHDFRSNATPTVIVGATCSLEGVEITEEVCSICKTVKDFKDGCDVCEKYETKEIDQDYIDHLVSEHSGKKIDKVAHTYGSTTKDVVTVPSDCETETVGTKVLGAKVCTVCGDVDSTGCETEKIPWAHTPDPNAETTEEIKKEATCTEKGEKEISSTCEVCQQPYTVTEPIETIDHVRIGGKRTELASTCVTPGKIIVEAVKCEVCNTVLEKGKEETLPLAAHKWGPFQESDAAPEETPTTPTTRAADDTEGTEDTDDTETPETPSTGSTGTAGSCGKAGEVRGYVECTVCHVREWRTIEIPASNRHTFGDWETVKEPTETEPGQKQRTCSVCNYVETLEIPATGTDEPDDPSDPDDPSEPSNPSNPSTPDSNRYTITLIQASNGYLSAPSAAIAGNRVTITVQANSGYELDSVTATRSNGNVVPLNGIGSNQYTFTMPYSNVEIRAYFTRRASSSSDTSTSTTTTAVSRWDPVPGQNPTQSVPRLGASGQTFYDIPSSHWAAGEINWANQAGYMNGSNGRFNPDGTITFQQLWMVLARLTGSRPTNMEDARHWAVVEGFAEGFNPNYPVARHQLVTALYRCAHLMGTANNATTSLAGYTDSRTVPGSARSAMAWAVANGIVSGTSDGRLNPNATITRAQFAVLLYRFSQRV